MIDEVTVYFTEDKQGLLFCAGTMDHSTGEYIPFIKEISFGIEGGSITQYVTEDQEIDMNKKPKLVLEEDGYTAVTHTQEVGFFLFKLKKDKNGSS